MGASERIAALRRARQRQARIEAATARTLKAHATLDRAVQAKAAAIQRYDERVANAEAASFAETAELAQVCGSAEAAAEILGWSVRDVRRVVKTEKEKRAATATSTRRRSDVTTAANAPGGTDDGRA